MIKGVSHIGIAVFSIEKALPFYGEALGLAVSHIEVIKSEGVRIAFIPVGKVRIELLEPLDEQSSVFKFLQKHGEGVHHVAFFSDDLTADLKKASNYGSQVLGDPKIGAENTKVAFIHPKSAHGVLTEFCQVSKDV